MSVTITDYIQFGIKNIHFKYLEFVKTDFTFQLHFYFFNPDKRDTSDSLKADRLVSFCDEFVFYLLLQDLSINRFNGIYDLDIYKDKYFVNPEIPLEDFSREEQFDIFDIPFPKATVINSSNMTPEEYVRNVREASDRLFD